MRRFVFVSMAGLALASPASAAEPTPDVVLEPLLQHALAHSPELMAAQARAAAGASRPRAERGLPPSMLSVVYTNDGWSPTLGEMEMTTLGVMASQPLPDAGGRALRARRAERSAALLEQQVRRVRLDLVAGVTRAYHDLRLARALLAVAREQGALWEEIEASTRARYGAGLGPQLDVMRAQVEVTRSRERVIAREAEAEVRLFELNRRAARPLVEAIGDTPPLELASLPASLEEILRVAETESPELLAAHEALEGQHLGVAIARRQARPEWNVQAGYMNRGGLDPMWQAGLGVSWPLFSRGAVRAGAAAAAEEERAAERDVEAVRADLLLRTRQRFARLGALARGADLYGNGILSQGELALEAAQAQYRAGRAPLVSVLDAMSALVQDRATYLEQIAAHESLKARLWSFSLEPDEGGMPAAPSMGARPSMGAAPAPMGGAGGPMTAPPADGGTSGMGEGR